MAGLIGLLAGPPALDAEPAPAAAEQTSPLPPFAQEQAPAGDPEALLRALPVPTPGTGQPARFGGWLQPWTVALICGLPVVWALLERRSGLAHALRRRAWKQGEGPKS